LSIPGSATRSSFPSFFITARWPRVARAIHISATHSDSIGRIFHLCSGPEHALRLTDLVSRLRSRAVSGGKTMPRLRYVSRRWFDRTARLVKWLSRGRLRRATASLPYFLAYLAESQSFVVADTVRYLSRFKLFIPPPDEYLLSLLDAAGQYRRR